VASLKSLVGKVQKKKEELEREEAKRAAAKAAEMAVERGKDMAKAAVAQAGKSLRSAGAFVEEKLFGAEPDEDADVEEGGEDGGERAPDPEPVRRRAAAPRKPEPSAAEKQARFDQEVDEELAALKRKLDGK
jgi:hypothetical protein